ncbi:3-hydroxyisobutyrate dehydrogenase [Marmoricola sp. Leaf446]|uniref:NAD(P)-dependent oxidoreductase n=1 Tax=Marmoricola sp. Leaf446 TaxID=1736379 RepID=UPI0006F8A799|nr:NAD(P)-dependent oxidoreductase [Marmoricola sp. Leaf446]KQT94715.1 3-hydroxyisobutyrate dehydrogenase [Marmoricola sp. Leaf446]
MSSSSTPSVALLGTGTMGAGMARNIAAAGLPLTVWNRSPEKARPLADVATVADDLVSAVEGADVVVTMLYDADSVVDTMEQLRGHLGADTVWLQQSTIGVEGSDRVVALAADLGVMLVDAPVLGTKKPAEDGALVVLAAGPSDVRDRVAPVLDAVGSRTIWVAEEPGGGSRLKLAANAWVVTVLEGVADSLTLTRELGLDPALFLEAVSGGAMDAPYVQLKGKAMLAGSYEPAFALSGALKDVDLILAAAGSAGVDLAAMPGIRDHLARAVDAGHGDEDMAATYAAH